MVTTATSTKLLAVNSAFMQEIKDGNPSLTNAMQQMQQVCSSKENSLQVSRQLTKVLNALRVELALQFALEESYGYMEVSESMLQDLSETAQNTKAQHNGTTQRHLLAALCWTSSLKVELLRRRSCFWP